MLKNITSSYHLFLSIAAFYLGYQMFTGYGVFAEFPTDWINTMPFSNWESLAWFGIIVFGIGNLLAGIYGFTKKKSKVYLLSAIMGSVLFLCAAMPIILLGEWYLPIALFFLVSSIQVLLGVTGIIGKKI